MRFTTTGKPRLPMFLHCALAAAISAAAGSAVASDSIEEVIVLEKQVYSNNLVSEGMQQQQSSITSVNSVIDNLPGVTVNEGDVYGFDDWSTAITIRGFTTNLSEQQVGTTIDGIPNGGSNYGGGAKANRFVDPMNLSGVEVSQGTADIASRSHEALGGTLNYLTDAPLEEQRIRVEGSVGEQDARRVAVRFDTGLMGEDTYAWISFAKQEATDWVTETAENEREHAAAKLVSNVANTEISAYISYDEIHEDNYQRIYNEAQFQQLPYEDGLTGEWTGVPFEDQLYRRGWSTNRENLLGYIKFDSEISEDLNVVTSLYHHKNAGRGDWLPPYLINATEDDGGNSEFLGGSTSQVAGVDTSSKNRIFFVDAEGNALTPNADCSPSYTVNNWYGVPVAPASAIYDPSCYADGAIPVMSFRNTHYKKSRSGLAMDLSWGMQLAGMDNEIRAGVWYEDQERDEYRDWHSVDTRVGFVYNPQPYFVQYSRTYPQTTTKWYLQNSLSTGPVTFTLGVKQFFVEVEREDHFDSSLNAKVDSDSDVLLSGGFVWETDIDGLEIFAGYAENFRALNDLVLERPAADIDGLEPETSENMELGLRYNSGDITASAVYFQNDFENRIIFLDNSTTAGPDFAIGTNGTFFNAGGIEASGLELSVDYAMNDQLNLFVAYTYNDATYLGSGDAAVDASNGIDSGNDVAGIPESQFAASVDWTSDMFYAGISAKYTGDRFVNQSNSWTADAYTTADLYVGARLDNVAGFAKGANVKLLVNNAFDKQYLGTIAENAAWLGGPRTISLSATLDF